MPGTTREPQGWDKSAYKAVPLPVTDLEKKFDSMIGKKLSAQVESGPNKGKITGGHLEFCYPSDEKDDWYSKFRYHVLCYHDDGTYAGGSMYLTPENLSEMLAKERWHFKGGKAMNSQQKFREPNLFGHVYDGNKSNDGYAVCSACHHVENTSEAASPCRGTLLGHKLARLAAGESDNVLSDM